MPNKTINNNIPLYNSRILKIFLEYLRKNHPDIKPEAVLREAGIESFEIEDPGHWFTQGQVDRFYDVLVKKTDEPGIARYAGRYITSTEGLGPLRQYVLGLMNPETIYLLMEKLYRLMSRGANVKARKIGPSTVEIVSTPMPGVKEKPFQCENRLGSLEGLAKLFTDQYARIDHPNCFHRGDDSCRYIITWQDSPPHFWKRARNYFLLAGGLISGALFFALPTATWALLVLILAFLASTLSYYFKSLENKSLVKTIEDQRNAAEENLLESNIRYNNALLIHEIGQATSQITDVDTIINTVAGIMERLLDFDRGMIMLANKERTRLIYKGGYGYTKEQKVLLEETAFHLDNPRSRGLFVRAMRERKPFLVNNINDIENTLSQRSLEFARRLKSHALICVPIIYERESLGILAVDSIKSKTNLRKSDLNLLMGVASETAISIVNATALQKIKESEARYRLLADNISDVIWILDIPELRFSDVSSSVERMQGYTPEEFKNLTLKEILPPESLNHVTGLITNALAAERTEAPDSLRTLIFETEQYHRDGSLIWIEVTASFLRDASGAVTGILGVSRDITARKKAEKEKKELESKLQQSHKMEAIGTLAGGIAHDFNNILYAIMGYTELALNSIDDRKSVTDKLQKVLKAGYRARDLVKQILAFSRQAELEKKTVRIKPVIEEALNLLRSSIPTTIQIRRNLQSDSTVLADPTQIHQILINLCTNAEQAMSETGGTLEVSLTDVVLDHEFASVNPGIKPGPHVCLAVSDTGLGMSSELLKRLFDPFFTTKEPGKGTGLGLAVVHGIVRSHGGAITVRSEPGKGSVFKVFLPVIEKPVESELKVDQVVQTGSERILFVDDEEILINMGKELLEQLGYEVRACSKASEALELFKAHPDGFDLVITDMAMPEMSGKRLAEELMDIRPDIPIVLCTGFSEVINKERAKKMGIREFVMKPITLTEIAGAVRRALDT